MFRRILVLLALLCATNAGAQVLVLRNFTLIDGRGGKPLPRAALLIRDGRIEFTGPDAQLKAPPGAVTRDLAGKFVMPGIINLHGHLGNVSGLKQDPQNFTRANVEKDLKTYASYGVTSVASLGSDQELIFQIRDEQRSSRLAGMTRVYTAYRGFTGKNGYPTTVPGMKGVPYEVATEGDVENAVGELARKRADLVKIWVDDHLGRESKIPLEMSKAIIREAHQRRLKAVAHIFYLQDARDLVNAGLDGLAHSVRDRPVDDGLIAEMKKRGAWQMAATLAREFSTFAYARPAPFLDDPFFTRSIPGDVLSTLKSPAYQQRVSADPDLPRYPGFLETAKKNLKRLVDAGVPYGFGTDSGPPARFQGSFEHLEMELMVQAGLTPMQVITAATRNSAEFLGVSKDFGTLEKGKWADLLVLNADPLSDVRNTRSIEAVYVAGNLVAR